MEPVSKAFPNYLNFIKWHNENRGVEIERFRPGRADQIVLCHNAGKYPEFQVRNLAANGRVWTGVDTIVRDHFIDRALLPIGTAAPFVRIEEPVAR